NLAQDKTPFPTPRGHVVHSNLSSKASLGGEAWFTSEDSVTINAKSGRFGAGAGMSRAEWDAAVRYWEGLGYKVKAIPGQDRESSLVLRSASDSWISPQVAVRSKAQYVRDQWARRTALEMGRLAARGRFVHVCVNGLYWGLYNLIERTDDEYLAHQLGADDDYYVTIRERDGRIETNASGERMWDQISQLAATDLNEPAQFAAIAKLVDVPDLIDNCLVLMYAGAEDRALSDENQLGAYYRRGSNAKLRFMIENADSIFASGWENESVDIPLLLEEPVQPGSFPYLFQRLMKSEEFRKVFSSRVEKWCGQQGVLGAAACEQRYKAIIGEVEPVLIAELARWGDVHSSDPNTLMLDWQKQKEWILENWFPNRTETILKELKRCGLISGNRDSETKSE
ncbi:CotH kinase family protein, partial [bacterium]|nr:CotH kinase family protein [bacterium]